MRLSGDPELWPPSILDRSPNNYDNAGLKKKTMIKFFPSQEREAWGEGEQLLKTVI